MRLWELIGLTFLFNVMTFGNGPLMIPLLDEHLVRRREVLSVDELLYAFTIARITPGPANTYVAAVGYMIFGIVGAVLTTIAVVLPGYLMLLLVHGYGRVQATRVVQGLTRGLVAASVGLIFAVTLEMGRTALVSPTAWTVFLIALVLHAVLKRNPILSLLISAAVGLVLTLLV